MYYYYRIYFHNIDLNNEARTNGVIILCFPPHTTHRLQVTDVVSMRPLSTYYNQAVSTWSHTNPGMVVTIRKLQNYLVKFLFKRPQCQPLLLALKLLGFGHMIPTFFFRTWFCCLVDNKDPASWWSYHTCNDCIDSIKYYNNSVVLYVSYTISYTACYLFWGSDGFITKIN